MFLEDFYSHLCISEDDPAPRDGKAIQHDDSKEEEEEEEKSLVDDLNLELSAMMALSKEAANTRHQLVEIHTVEHQVDSIDENELRKREYQAKSHGLVPSHHPHSPPHAFQPAPYGPEPPLPYQNVHPQPQVYPAVPAPDPNLLVYSPKAPGFVELSQHKQEPHFQNYHSINHDSAYQQSPAQYKYSYSPVLPPNSISTTPAPGQISQHYNKNPPVYVATSYEATTQSTIKPYTEAPNEYHHNPSTLEPLYYSATKSIQPLVNTEEDHTPTPSFHPISTPRPDLQGTSQVSVHKLSTTPSSYHKKPTRPPALYQQPTDSPPLVVTNGHVRPKYHTAPTPPTIPPYHPPSTSAPFYEPTQIPTKFTPKPAHYQSTPPPLPPYHPSSKPNENETKKVPDSYVSQTKVKSQYKEPLAVSTLKPKLKYSRPPVRNYKQRPHTSRKHTTSKPHRKAHPTLAGYQTTTQRPSTTSSYSGISTTPLPYHGPNIKWYPGRGYEYTTRHSYVRVDFGHSAGHAYPFASSLDITNKHSKPVGSNPSTLPPQPLPSRFTAAESSHSNEVHKNRRPLIPPHAAKEPKVLAPPLQHQPSQNFLPALQAVPAKGHQSSEVLPALQAVPPAVQPISPVAHPVHPVVHPVPQSHPVHPVAHPAPQVQPAHPVVHPAPQSHPVHPVVHPVHPVTHPVSQAHKAQHVPPVIHKLPPVHSVPHLHPVPSVSHSLPQAPAVPQPHPASAEQPPVLQPQQQPQASLAHLNIPPAPKRENTHPVKIDKKVPTFANFPIKSTETPPRLPPPTVSSLPAVHHPAFAAAPPQLLPSQLQHDVAPPVTHVPSTFVPTSAPSPAHVSSLPPNPHPHNFHHLAPIPHSIAPNFAPAPPRRPRPSGFIPQQQPPPKGTVELVGPLPVRPTGPQSFTLVNPVETAKLKRLVINPNDFPAMEFAESQKINVLFNHLQKKTTKKPSITFETPQRNYAKKQKPDTHNHFKMLENPLEKYGEKPVYDKHSIKVNKDKVKDLYVYNHQSEPINEVHQHQQETPYAHNHKPTHQPPSHIYSHTQPKPQDTAGYGHPLPHQHHQHHQDTSHQAHAHSAKVHGYRPPLETPPQPVEAYDHPTSRPVVTGYTVRPIVKEYTVTTTSTTYEKTLRPPTSSYYQGVRLDRSLTKVGSSLDILF